MPGCNCYLRQDGTVFFVFKLSFLSFLILHNSWILHAKEVKQAKPKCIISDCYRFMRFNSSRSRKCCRFLLCSPSHSLFIMKLHTDGARQWSLWCSNFGSATCGVFPFIAGIKNCPRGTVCRCCSRHSAGDLLCHECRKENSGNITRPFRGWIYFIQSFYFMEWIYCPQKCGGERQFICGTFCLWKSKQLPTRSVINNPRNVAHNLLDCFQKKKKRAYRVAFDSPLKCVSAPLYHPSCKGIGYILPSR